jgi:hypothetical protein
VSSYVYFAEDSRRRFIKIGWSCDPVGRLKSLTHKVRTGVRLIAVVPGSYRLEQQALERFAHKRTQNALFRGQKEWFIRCAEILRFARKQARVRMSTLPDSGALCIHGYRAIHCRAGCIHAEPADQRAVAD